MKKIYIFIILILFALAHGVDASTVELSIDTKNQEINALEGEVILPSGLSMDSIHTGSSIVLVWLESPTWEEGGRIVKFKGIIPGGFKGVGKILAINFKEEVAESLISTLKLEHTQVLLNDGLGTKAQVSFAFKSSEVGRDDIAPEPFKPSIAKIEGVNGKEWVLIFHTLDKGTGVKNYEYASTWLLGPADESWQEANSPQTLKRFEKFKKLHVRAFDQEGNFRVVTTFGPYWFLTLAFGLIILLCLGKCIERFLRSR